MKKFKKRYNKQVPLLKVDIPKVLELYHVSWGKSNGVVGRCKSIDFEKKTVILISPKTKLEWKYPVPFTDLRYTRKKQTKIKNAAR